MDIFRADGDRLTFLKLVERQVVDRRWTCIAYCLMSNHYHLLLHVPGDDLSAGMHAVGLGYAKTFNRAYRRVGHVFQSRFGAVVVSTESHTLELARYVALNPVRAGLCDRPERWRWSSYGAMFGEGWCPPGLRSERLLDVFGTSRERSINNLRRFVDAGMDHGIATTS
jgi:REP element-mobilizing transposase RayT